MLVTERIAMERASRYGLLEEYKYLRRRGYSIEHALRDWDLWLYGEDYTE